MLPPPLSLSRGPAGGDGATAYAAAIPGGRLSAGDLLRWAVVATGADGRQARAPAEGYYGTMVEDGAGGGGGLPVLRWWTEDEAAASSEAGGGGAIFYAGRLYDGVTSKRIGQTALSWKKAKLRFKLPEGSGGFAYRDGAPRVGRFKLNSLFVELGERSYIKETVAWQARWRAGG